MVDRGSRYVAGTEGAPPLPPPGGYRGARRVAPTTPPVAPPASGAPTAPAPPPSAPPAAWPLADHHAPEAAAPRERSAHTGAMGWIAIGAATVFALILLVTLASGAVGALYGTTLLVLQLLVLVAVVAALCTARGRLLGAAALAVALVFNVATLGGVGAVGAEALGAYDGQKSDEQKFWEAYPGIKDDDPGQALYQPSLEDVRAEAEATLAAVRQRLTAEYGIQWVAVGDEVLRPERNGYGGESMLQQYTSASWASTEPITGYTRKLAVMHTIEDVLWERGWEGMWAFNDPRSGIDPSIIQKMYGGDRPENQVNWEWYAELWPDPGLFYADIVDLANDGTGQYRASREATSARTGEPLEGLQLVVIAGELLSADDAAAYEDALKRYP
ncbi:hypothetical protein GCM10025768_01340 [Microbacterium pseudoresistens]|uniref:Uncharacterized protein n=1 Tax=Microbacterium pseudoresistens TaxID=640634 RepID=A0A7Y9EU22_9MICO|nr:hypothetical protein [Microbacterium pseudoresistens]NYD53969.1 hypothetical protein [Microbacterium pseudoresistens]